MSAHVAHLARLDLTADEVERYTGQLGVMLDHFRDIDALDLVDVPPMNPAAPSRTCCATTWSGATLDRDEVLAAAPAVEDGQFRVPPILGEEP